MRKSFATATLRMQIPEAISISVLIFRKTLLNRREYDIAFHGLQALVGRKRVPQYRVHFLIEKSVKTRDIFWGGL